MRLWHVDLLPKLPKQWLMGQHRECCALRGKGWGKKHSTVDYVFKYNFGMLFDYHVKVMMILISQHNVNIDTNWYLIRYRGKILEKQKTEELPNQAEAWLRQYPEHNETYYYDCLINLKNKGIVINTINNQ